MKRSPLKRNTPLKAKTRLKPISDKRRAEAQKERDLKEELIKERGRTASACGQRCPLVELSHLKAKSGGGKATRKNCILECPPKHAKRHNRKQSGCLFSCRQKCILKEDSYV